jgi:hypothetical protein
MAEYPPDIEEFRNWLNTKSHIQVIKARQPEDFDNLVTILANNLGWIIAMIAAKSQNPAEATNDMAEALTHNIFEVAASWLPMTTAVEARDNKAFLDAFKARVETARKRREVS